MAERPPSLPWASPAQLEAALTELGATLRYPQNPGPGLVAAVTAEIERARATAPVPGRRGRSSGLSTASRPGHGARRGLVLAAALVLALAALGAAATFGVRGIRIVFGPAPVTTGVPASTSPNHSTPTAPGSGLFLGERMTLDQVRAQVRFPLAVPTVPGLGTPTAYLSETVAGGAVYLVYAAAPGLPADRGGGGVAMIVTEFVGRADRPALVKFAQPNTVIEDVSVGGMPGIWIPGPPHAIAYLLPDGTVSTQSLRLSGDALLWQRGAVTVRLESSVPEDRAIAIAASMR